MNDDERQAERERMAREALGGHYTCEDCWYSCPLSEDGCCDDSVPKHECTCGLDQKVQRVVPLLKATEAAVLEELANEMVCHPYWRKEVEAWIAHLRQQAQERRS